MDYKPLKHLGLDHDLDHYNLDGTPKMPDDQHTKVPVQAEVIAKTLDVIRQDKSKLVEEEYHPKEWALPKLQILKEKSSLDITTTVTPSSVNVKDNIVSMEITTSNSEKSSMTTTMQLLFFNGGILKFNCVNAANPSKFSFEIVEPPANLTPYNVTGKVNIEDEGLTVEMDEQAKLTCKFNPFSVSIVSTKGDSNDPLFEMNSKKSLMFDENLTADFTFHTEHLYGIPERAHHVFVEDTKHDLPYRFFNLDIFGYAAFSKNGLYGCIPIMITRKKDSSKWVSLFWQNTSETYAEIHKEKSISDTYWTSERGNLEAYIFVNHSVSAHYQSITNVVGKSAMPQYFSLGYHQCRYSYNDQQDLLQVNSKFTEHEIPCDTLTLDIDHTNEMRYFTWNYDLFPDPLYMQETLNRDKRKLITIADPHIKVDDNYFVYKGAIAKDLCIKDQDNKTFVGECWPGDSIYLDYLNEETRDFWASCYKYENYKDSTPNLFAWNDMNEPSVFESKDKTVPKEALQTVKTLAEPEKAFQVEHREVHNIFGFGMSKATYAGLLRRNPDQNIRPHALSRSFFAGSQKYCTIWTGDTLSSWEHLKISLPMLLSMSLCGMSFVGSDVGGFVGDPEPELMVRWYQLGIFMPYFRGHSDKRCSRREPWLYPKKSFELVKDTIKERYRLLAYWYTCFEEHCRTGLPLMRPTWLDPDAVLDAELMNDEDRFLLGDAVLVEAILEPGKDVIKNPLRGLEGRWYNYYTKKEILPEEENHIGIERIGCYVKGGKGIPLFDVRTYMKSSKDVREANLTLLIGLDEQETANGTLYVDDGETFDYKAGKYTRKNFKFQNNQLTWENAGEGNYEISNRVTKVIIMGLKNTNFKGGYLQGDNEAKKSIQVVKNVDNVTLEFVALANQNWKIVLN